MATSATDGAHLTDALAAYAANTSFDDLPPEVVDRAKQVVLDVCGVALLGSAMPAGQITQRYVTSLGGRSESVLLGSAIRVPAPMAALANATAAHADELDDVHALGSHPGACIVPAALAIAERDHKSGRDVINGVVLGYDVGTRLITALGGMRSLMIAKHVSPDIVSPFSAAAAVGRLLGLSADVMHHVWAYSAAQASAPVAFLAERRHLSKAFSDGQAAYAGVTAAVLASLGMEGNDEIFDAPDGVFALWADEATVNPLELVADLGSQFAIMKTNFKFYSAGYPIHAAIEAAFRIVRENHLQLQDITEIEVRMPTVNAYIVDKRAMPSISVHDMLPVALRYGRLGPSEAHDEASLNDPMVQRLRETVKLVPDDTIGADDAAYRAAAVTIRTPSKSASCQVLHPQGNHRTTVTWAQLEDKFFETSDGRIPNARANDLVTAVKSLEGVGDMTEVAELLLR